MDISDEAHYRLEIQGNTAGVVIGRLVKACTIILYYACTCSIVKASGCGVTEDQRSIDPLQIVMVYA
jgi:hypothetical protein